MNKHKDHIASCLCCTKIIMHYEEGYSEYTPPYGPYINCRGGHFYFEHFELSHEVMLELHDRGRDCEDFEPRE